MRPDVALLDASGADDDANRNFRRELPARVHRYRVLDGEFPRGDRSFDAVVVSGSRASVYWDEDWIGETEAYVRDALDRGWPVLGVCFGHQLVADALGGTVEDMGEYEIGYHEVHHVGASRLFEGVPEWFTAFTAHSDEVTALPQSAVRLAGNNFSRVHAFRDGRAFGVQFHPAFDFHTAKKALEARDVREDRIEHVLDRLGREHFREYTAVKRVLRNFTGYAAEVARGEEGGPRV